MSENFSASVTTEQGQSRAVRAHASLVSVGLVGLGNVGMHYAAHLRKTCGVFHVYDIAPDKVAAAARAGARASGSARDLAAQSDTVVLALPDPEAAEEAMLGPQGVLAVERPGALIVDLSTIDPGTARRLHAEALHRHRDYVEAPMSGGEPGGAGAAGARAGTVTFMVGGEETAVARAEPLLKLLGAHAIHVGPAGAGNTVKLISNLIAGLNMAVAAEGFVLGAAAGFPPGRLLELFRHTDARSFTLMEEFARHVCADDFEGGFPVDLMHKDHRLAAGLGRAHGVPLPFNRLALEVYQACRVRGLGRKSHAVVAQVMADDAGVFLRERGP